MPRLACPFTPCDSVTEDDDKDIAIALYNAHVSTHAANAGASTPSRGERLQRPRVSQGMLEENWLSYQVQWDMYKEGARLQPDDLARQLLQCCDHEVLEIVLRAFPTINTKSEKEVLEAIKKIAVVPVAMGVRRSDMLAIRQDNGEPARSYAAKIQGKAATCAFTIKCTKPLCETNVDYTDTLVKYVLVNGIADDDIKGEVLGWADLDSSTLAQCIAFLEQKEMARDALKRDQTNAANKSGYKEMKDDPRLKMRVKCDSCDTVIPKFAPNRLGVVGERTKCTPCWKKYYPINPR